MDRDNIRMIQRSYRARLTRKASQTFRIGGTLSGRILIATSRPNRGS
jgi:hypothetical protein